MAYLPYLFGGARLLLGLACLVKLLKLFNNKPFKPDSFLGKHETLSFLLAGFLVLSGLYTIFFSFPDSCKV